MGAIILFPPLSEPRDLQKDLEMVYRPDRWPLKAALPLTHLTEKDPDCPIVNKLGFILYNDPTTVHEGCLHSVAMGLQRLEDLAERRYATVTEMLTDWRVD